MPTAYSWLRCSTGEQVKGDTFRRQLEMTTDLCSRNRWTLDTSLKIGAGVSAFKGGQRKATTGLGAFIKRVADGDIAKGSILVIERLDRLSREEIPEALELFLSIIRQGVSIATVSPENHYTRESIRQTGVILQAVLEFIVANEESTKRSDRIARQWEAKRQAIRQGRKWLNRKDGTQTAVATNIVPSWLRIGEGRKILEDKPQADIVRKVFRMYLDGFGVQAIAVAFNREKVPTLRNSRRTATAWRPAMVLDLLTNRSVMGEYQPKRWETKSKRVAVGDPIAGYYPETVKEADFYKAEKIRTKRQQPRGARGQQVSNLFSNVLFSMDDGSPMLFVKKESVSIPRLVSSAQTHKKVGGQVLSMQYRLVEAAFLQHLTEIKAATLCPAAPDTKDEAADLAAALGAVEGRIEFLKGKINSGADFASAFDLLQTAETEKKRLRESLANVKATKDQTDRSQLEQAATIAGLLAKATGEELLNLRSRLRLLIAQTVETIGIKIFRQSKDIRSCVLLINYRGGGFRTIAIGEIPAEAKERYMLKGKETAKVAAYQWKWKAAS